MRYRVNTEKLFSDVTDGIAILIEIETGIYYGMNRLTTNVYENIIDGVDTDKLLSELTSVKGFCGETKEKYLALVRELSEKEFILEDNSASADVHLNFDEIPGEDLDFVLNEYPDASELLLADPIHQVKEDVGWQPDKDALK